MVWALDWVYGYRRYEILHVLEMLSALPVLQLEDPEAIEELLASARQANAELPELLIGLSAKAHRCETTLTFDRKTAKTSPLFKWVA